MATAVARTCTIALMVLPLAVSVKRGPVQHGSQIGLLILAGQNVQVLCRAFPISRETKKLEQKRTAPGVARVVPDLHAQRLNRFV